MSTIKSGLVFKAQTKTKTKAKAGAKIDYHQCLACVSASKPEIRCAIMTSKDMSFCKLHVENGVMYDQTRTAKLEFEIDNHAKMQALKSKHHNNPEKIHISTTKNLYGQHIFQTQKLKAKPVVAKSQTANSKFDEKDVHNLAYIREQAQRDLDVKLYMAINSDVDDRLPGLIGPVYPDVTKSEDAFDLITMEPFWTETAGCRSAANVNIYCLFSYLDAQNKIRCFTMFSIKTMIDSAITSHPVTNQPIPEADLQRANRLIAFYQDRIGDFMTQQMSAELTVKNRIEKMFKTFEKFSIYLDANWVSDIVDAGKINRVISKTRTYVENNLAAINAAAAKPRWSKYNGAKLSDALDVLVREWEALIGMASSAENQLPVWIIVASLATVCPHIQQKFPDLKLMLDTN